MQLLELIARKNKLSYVMTFVPDCDIAARAKSFFLSKLKSFAVSNIYTEDGEGIVVLQKCLDKAILAAQNKKAKEAKEMQDSIMEALKLIEINKAKAAAANQPQGKENGLAP